MATLKTWRLLSKLRRCLRRATAITAAILVLQTTEDQAQTRMKNVHCHRWPPCAVALEHLLLAAGFDIESTGDLPMLRFVRAVRPMGP